MKVNNHFNSPKGASQPIRLSKKISHEDSSEYLVDIGRCLVRVFFVVIVLSVCLILSVITKDYGVALILAFSIITILLLTLAVSHGYKIQDRN